MSRGIVNINDVLTTGNPFEEYGITGDDYVPISDILGQKIVVKDVKVFNNDKGEGVFAYIEHEDGEGYICTHSVGITGKLRQLDEMGIFVDSDVELTIIKRKSTSSNNFVYCIQ